MRQLVKAKIVSSIASKNGGFVLLKTPSRITFLDLFNAIEGQEQFAVSTSLVDRVFDSRKQGKGKGRKNHALSAWCGIGISKEIKRNHHPADLSDV